MKYKKVGIILILTVNEVIALKQHAESEPETNKQRYIKSY